jgi:excisionase family DNA binding protein
MDKSNARLGGVAETCATLGIGKSKLYELLKSGALRGRKLGRRTLFLEEDVRAFAQSLPVIEQKCVATATEAMLERTGQGVAK